MCLQGFEKHQAKKKVRFAKQKVLELPSENKTSDHRNVTRARRVKAEKNIHKQRRGPKLEDVMPPNRAVLYRGIIKYRTLNHGRLRF